ncbi:hypothetical protein HRbin05_00506 [archaeon HR05]|nr:hypothetical protein HRbin05_00506 [archaeon HR05]
MKSRIDKEFLFGNNLTVGGVGLKDGSGVGATILVVDSYYEDAVKAKLDDIRAVLMVELIARLFYLT